jgi:hypothetical protein
MLDMREFVIPAPFARTASEWDQAGTHAPYHLPLDAALHDHRIPMPYVAKTPCVYILASRRNGTLYRGRDPLHIVFDI